MLATTFGQIREELRDTWRDAFAWLPANGRETRFALIGACVGINVLALALPIFILQIYDRVLPNHAETTLVVLIVGLGVALILDAGLRALRAHIATWSAAALEHKLRLGIVERFLGASLAHFEAESVGTHLERVNAVGAVRDFHASQVLFTFVDLPFAVLFLMLIAFFGGWLVLVPLVLLAVFAASALWIGRALRASVALRSMADQERYGFLVETLKGIHTIKALALNAMTLRRHEACQEKSDAAIESVMHQSALAQTLGVMFSQINMAALVAFGALLVLDGSMTVGALAASTLLGGRALQPLQSAMSLWTNFQGIRVAQNQIAEALKLPAETSGDFSDEITGNLTFDRVTYHNDIDDGLSGASFQARPGEIVAIEGDAGAAKSTLLLIALGLVTPQNGRVCLDGRDMREFESRWVRSRIALLPRNGTLYSGTILDNLTNFHEGECINEALYLSYLLGLDEALKRLPDGFDTRVGAGERLPAGLRQRIAIIRELIKRPKIILCDDADHALDSDGAARLVSLLRELSTGATILLSSGRSQVLQAASRRLRLSGGRLIPISSDGKGQVQEVSR